MSVWLRLFSVLLIALCAGVASAGAETFGRHTDAPSVHHASDSQSIALCGLCVGHEAAACAESCAGSLQSERRASLVHLDAIGVFLRCGEEDLREGLQSPPDLTPPIA